MDVRDRRTPALYTEFDGLERAQPRVHSRRRKRGYEEEMERYNQEEVDESAPHEVEEDMPHPKRPHVAHQGYNYAARVSTIPEPKKGAKYRKPDVPGDPDAVYTPEEVQDAFHRMKYAIPTAEGYIGLNPMDDDETTQGIEFEPDFVRAPPFDNPAKFTNYNKLTTRAKEVAEGVGARREKNPFSIPWLESVMARKDMMHTIPLYDSMVLLAAKFASAEEDFFIQHPDMREFAQFIQDGLKDLESERKTRGELNTEARAAEEEIGKELQESELLSTDIAEKAFPALAADPSGAQWADVLDQMKAIGKLPKNLVLQVVAHSPLAIGVRQSQANVPLKYLRLLNEASNAGIAQAERSANERDLLSRTNALVDMMAAMMVHSPAATLFQFLSATADGRKQLQKWEAPKGFLRLDSDTADLLRSAANWKEIFAPYSVSALEESRAWQNFRSYTQSFVQGLFTDESANGLGEVGSENGLGLSTKAAQLLFRVLHLTTLDVDEEQKRLFIALGTAMTAKTKLNTAARACADLMRSLFGMERPVPGAPVPAAPAPGGGGAPVPGGGVAAAPGGGGPAAPGGGGPAAPGGGVAAAPGGGGPAAPGGGAVPGGGGPAAPAPGGAPAPAPARASSWLGGVVSAFTRYFSAAPSAPAAAPVAAAVEEDVEYVSRQFGEIDDVAPKSMTNFLRLGVEIEELFTSLWDAQVPWGVDARLLAAREFFSYEYVRTTIMVLVIIAVQSFRAVIDQRKKRLLARLEILGKTDYIDQILERHDLRRKFMRMYWYRKQPHLQPTFAISGRARVIIDAAELAIRKVGGDWAYFDSGPTLAHFWIDKTEPNAVPQACSFREVLLSYMHLLERDKETMNGITTRSAREERAMIMRQMNYLETVLTYVPRHGDEAKEYPPYHPIYDRNMNFYPGNI